MLLIDTQRYPKLTKWKLFGVIIVFLTSLCSIQWWPSHCSMCTFLP